MGAVEEAQILAALSARADAAEAGIVRAVSRVLGMVADDLTEVVGELQSHALDDSSTRHALGLVTGMIGVLDALAPARPTLHPRGVEAAEV